MSVLARPPSGHLSSLFGNVVHLVVREKVQLIASAMHGQEGECRIMRREGAKVETEAGDCVSHCLAFLSMVGPEAHAR